MMMGLLSGFFQWTLICSNSRCCIYFYGGIPFSRFMERKVRHRSSGLFDLNNQVGAGRGIVRLGQLQE
jgi:hypothetical protein